MHITGPAKVVVLMTYEVRAPVAVLQMMTLSLRDVRDIPVVTELSCGLECSVGTPIPNWVYCPLFMHEKPKRLPQGFGTFPWLPSRACLEPP